MFHGYGTEYHIKTLTFLYATVSFIVIGV